MRSNNPPGIATWMLEHLTFGRKNEALAGDLLEEFRRGRPATWYWRQVLVAIVIGFAGELGTQWAALIYATLCAIPVPAYWMLALNKVMDSPFFAGRWHLEWPYSTICDLSLFWGFQIIYIWCALVLYFLLFSLATRTVNLHSLARSLWKSTFIFMAIYAGLIAFFALFPGHGVQGIDRRHVTVLSGITDPRFLVFRLPFFFTLFLSIWRASGDKKPTRVVLT
ncbi:MAG TPA: hypothetical protein VJW20_10935 [Candidatus Angelobacter sp.]|nr:hypothetical protein [Candidatus Angelobacter sp.]